MDEALTERGIQKPMRTVPENNEEEENWTQRSDTKQESISKVNKKGKESTLNINIEYKSNNLDNSLRSDLIVEEIEYEDSDWSSHCEKKERKTPNLLIALEKKKSGLYQKKCKIANF